MKAIRLHPIYEALTRTEFAWAVSVDQAAARANIVVNELVKMGLITGGEWVEGFYCRKAEPPL